MKRKSVKRILTACLIFALIFTCVNTPLIRAEAESTTDAVEEVDENEAVQSESDNTEEVADEGTEDTGFTDGSEAVNDTESVEQESEDFTSAIADEEDSEVLSPTFDASVDVDDVNIHVTAPEGVLPEGCSLKVEKVSDEDTKSKIKSAIDSERNIAKLYMYDIRVLDVEGNEVQPDLTYGKVNISFELNEVTDTNVEPSVYHVDNNYNAMELKTLDEASLVEDEKILSVETDGFSYYTVEFTYADKQYVLDGDTEVNLDDVLKTVGLSGTVSSAVSSNSELFSVEQKDDGWYVKAVKAFDDKEWLKVTINGLEYKITVLYGDKAVNDDVPDELDDVTEGVSDDSEDTDESDDESMIEPQYYEEYKLYVTTAVSGNGGNRNQEFNYELQLSGDNIPTEFTYDITEPGASNSVDSGTISVENGVVHFSLKHNQTIRFRKRLTKYQTCDYQVQELDGETYGYTVSYENQSGTLDGGGHAVKVLNNRMVIVPTSADTNSCAMGLIVGVGVAAVLLEVKKYRFLKR